MNQTPHLDDESIQGLMDTLQHKIYRGDIYQKISLGMLYYEDKNLKTACSLQMSKLFFMQHNR